MDLRFVSEFFRNLIASEEPSSFEYNVVDPGSTDGSVQRITLAYIPPTEELPTADVTLYWTESDSKLFEKRFDSLEEAMKAFSAIESDLSQVQQMTQANKLKEATNVMSSLIQQYSTRTDDTVDNAVPVEGEVESEAEPTSQGTPLNEFFQQQDMTPADYVINVARSVFNRGNGPLDAQKLHKYMEAASGSSINPEEVADLYEKVKRHLFANQNANPLTKSAGATVQNLFFDTIEELEQYQEKMKELNPDSDQLPGDMDLDLGTSEDDPLGPPSQSYEQVEEEEADKQKMMEDKIEREVEDQIASKKKEMISSTFGGPEENLVNAMREMGRTWEEIAEYFTKNLKFEKDSVNAYIDSLKGTPGDLHEPKVVKEEPPKPEVSPEVHDQLVDEVLEEEIPEDIPEMKEEIKKVDMAVAEIEKQDGEIKKKAEEPLETPNEDFESQEQFPKTDFPEAEDDMDQTSLTNPMDDAPEQAEEPTPGDQVWVSSDINSGETGFTATFVSKDVDNHDEYAVVQPEGKEAQVKIPMHRVTKAKKDSLNQIKADLETLEKEAEYEVGEETFLPGKGEKGEERTWGKYKVKLREPDHYEDKDGWWAKIISKASQKKEAASDPEEIWTKSIGKGISVIYFRGGEYSSDAWLSVQTNKQPTPEQEEAWAEVFDGAEFGTVYLPSRNTDQAAERALKKIQQFMQQTPTLKQKDPSTRNDEEALDTQQKIEYLQSLKLNSDQEAWEWFQENKNHFEYEIQPLTHALKQNRSTDQIYRDKDDTPEDPTWVPTRPGQVLRIIQKAIHDEINTLQQEFKEFTAQKKEADPTTEEQTKTVFKPDLKNAPKDKRKQEPIPANEDIEKAYQRVQTTQANLADIERIASGIRAKAAEEIQKLEQDSGKAKLIQDLDNGVLELMRVLEPLKGEVVEVSDKLITYSEIHDKEKAKWTYAQTINKIYEKFPEAEQYIENAKKGLQSQAQSIFKRVLEWFPKKSRLSARDMNVDVTADVSSFFDKLTQELMQAYKALQEIPETK